MDWFGNEVYLTEETWTTHIVIEHPEMIGCETIVQQALQDPAEILESTLYSHGAVFATPAGTGPGVQGIRAVVSYGEISYQKGASTGKIATAYPIDVIKYGRPHVGRPLFKK